LFIFCKLIFAGSKQAKVQQADLLTEDDYDSEEDEDYEAEDIDLEEFEQEDPEDLLAEQTEEDMPSTPARKRTPAKKSSAIPAGESKNVAVSEITSSMKKMNVNMSPTFNFNTVFPYTISPYDEGDDEMCDLFFFVPTTLPLEYFLPDVIDNGDVFSLSMRVPNTFFHIQRYLNGKQRCERLQQGHLSSSSIQEKMSNC
jgi:hypothetical protein